MADVEVYEPITETEFSKGHTLKNTAPFDISAPFKYSTYSKTVFLNFVTLYCNVFLLIINYKEVELHIKRTPAFHH